jgi:hypothetical protein
MPYKDKTLGKEKAREFNKNWYQANKDSIKARIKRRKSELSLWLKEIKGSLCCSNCRENHIACLEFHHVNPSEKDLVLARVVANGWSKERIQKELNKCIVLCSNCHRKLHYKENREFIQVD